jgi:tyrosinase
LNDPTRVITSTATASPGSVGQSVIDRILRTTDFLTFGGGVTSGPRVRGASGMLENTPHNYIHNFIGGTTGNMADPALAARDPIFWLHHANVDRLWARWTALHPGRNPTQSAWLNQAFSFTSTSGNPATLTVAQTLNMQSLGYSYAP